ncbi:alpha-L-fucosidase [Chitinophaga lutea]
MKIRNCLLWLLLPFMANAQYKPTWESIDSRPVPAWFENAKFGIFIHWGVYSVPAWAPKGVYSEWYQYWLQNKVKLGEKKQPYVYEYHNKVYGPDYSYYNFADYFRAEDYDPDAWAQVMKKSGARYVVLTSKHHDGFALWPSKEATKAFGRPWNAMDAASKRDVLGDLTTAVRKTDMKMGFYYSLYEWYNPLYKNRQLKQYVEEHMLPQLKDLVTRYQPDIVWPDGEWEQSDTVWQSREFLAWLYNESPVKDKVVVNDRWGKNMRQKHGGYYTTEYEVGKTFARPWEECRGIGFSFGYNRNEDIEDYNSAQALVYLLMDIVSSGGNLLLDIGPDAHGKIPPIMQERLLQIGRWLDVNGEAVYDTRAWRNTVQWSAGRRDWKAPHGLVSGNVLLKLTVDPDPGYAVKEIFFTRKGNTVYAVSPKLPEGKFIIKDLRASPSSVVSMLGRPGKLTWKQAGNDLEVTVPKMSANETPCEYAWTFKVTDAR